MLTLFVRCLIGVLLADDFANSIITISFILIFNTKPESSSRSQTTFKFVGVTLELQPELQHGM